MFLLSRLSLLVKTDSLHSGDTRNARRGGIPPELAANDELRACWRRSRCWHGDDHSRSLKITIKCVMNINIINTGLAGAVLAPSLWMATLPLSLQFVCVMLATLPASLLMARFGRRPVFIIGICIAITATLIQGLGLIRGDFGLFIGGSILLGVSHGTAQFYRYAAADAVPIADKPRAVSFVLLGGLFAALVGPEIAYRFAGAVPDAPYAGAFFGAAGVQLFAFFALAGLKIAPPDRTAPAGRPMGAFFRTSSFRLGLVVAKGAESKPLRVHCSFSGVDPFLRAVSGACGRGLGRSAAASPDGASSGACSFANSALDRLRLGVFAQCQVWELDRASRLCLV